MNELEIIEKFIRPLSGMHPFALHLSDDACVVDKLNTKQFVITTDAITENVHFLSQNSPRSIAKKLLAVNLSDIAAMGAIPKYYLCSIILSKDLDLSWYTEFFASLQEQNKIYGIVAIGGDTVKHDGPTSLSVTMIGEVDKYNAIARSGAKEGDNIYVTGTLGDAAIGLMIEKEQRGFILSEIEKMFFTTRYEEPSPRVEVGKRLVKIASAMIDISDGFIQDAGHIATNSNVQLEINSNEIPFSQPMQKLMSERGEDLLETTLTNGDDYELLFTAPPQFDNAIKEIADNTEIKITKIGKVVKGDKVVIRDQYGKELKFSKAGYVH